MSRINEMLEYVSFGKKHAGNVQLDSYAGAWYTIAWLHLHEDGMWLVNDDHLYVPQKGCTLAA